VPNQKVNVILMGKQNDGTDNAYVTNLIASINPNSIPVEFVYEIGVITKNNKRYNIHKPTESNSPKELNYKKIDEYVKNLPTDSEVVTMEIVLDLGKIDKWLTEQSSQILNKIFDED
jgi:hypothetical protein